MKTISMSQLIADLGGLFPEREDALRCAAVAALAKEHILFIGKPGTAKSLMSRIFAQCLDRTYFEALMHAYSTPEELFGPIALSGLQNDKFIRAGAGYAQHSEIVFLTEVFKSNTGMLNGLLTLLNERKFHDDGKPVSAPLMTCIGDSNELQDGPQLDALFDRFMLRVMVPYIADSDAFKRMLTQGPIVAPGVVDLLTEQAATAAVTLTQDTVDALGTLRENYNKAGFEASDRRWRQSIGLIKATTHLAGRKSTEPDDLEVLESVLWKQPDQRVAITKLVQAVISPDGARAVTELDAARGVFKAIPEVGTVDAGIYMGKVGGAAQDLAAIVLRLKAMPKGRKVNSALAEVEALKAAAGKLAMKAAGIEL
jgi:MoxR-like ATPase